MPGRKLSHLKNFLWKQLVLCPFWEDGPKYDTGHKAESSGNPSDTVIKADTAYSLEADEVVTINCTYSPRTADLDFGFITPDDTFHFTSGSNGSIKVNIQIEDTGKYYFAVRNNTSKTVEVLGYVYY